MQKKVILAVKAKARAKYFLGTLKQLMIRHKNKYFDLSREVLETGWLSIVLLFFEKQHDIRHEQKTLFLCQKRKNFFAKFCCRTVLAAQCAPKKGVPIVLKKEAMINFAVKRNWEIKVRAQRKLFKN